MPRYGDHGAGESSTSSSSFRRPCRGGQAGAGAAVTHDPTVLPSLVDDLDELLKPWLCHSGGTPANGPRELPRPVEISTLPLLPGGAVDEFLGEGAELLVAALGHR